MTLWNQDDVPVAGGPENKVVCQLVGYMLYVFCEIVVASE